MIFTMHVLGWALLSLVYLYIAGRLVTRAVLRTIRDETGIGD